MTKIDIISEFQHFIAELKTLFTVRTDIYKIFLKNKKLFYWFIIVLLLNSTEQISLITYKPIYSIIGILIKFLMQTFFILFCCSDFVERILQKCESVRRVATKTEKERLYPLFQEIYQKTFEENSLIGKNVRLYIVDSMEVNAFIIGRNTLAITRGALKMLNDNELKGIIAHEFGHLSNFDGVTAILINFCTTIYLLFFAVINVLLNYLEREFNDTLFSSLCGIVNQIIQLPVKIVYLVFVLLISGGSRKKEYKADTYACRLGYQEELKSALYKLYNIQVSDRKKGLIENLERTHPVLAYRIERLEDIVTTE